MAARSLGALLLLLLSAGSCLAERRLLHGGHAHEEAAAAADAPAAGVEPMPTGHVNGTWLDFINSTGHTDPTDYIVDALGGDPDALTGGNMSEILYVVGNSQNSTVRPVLGESPQGHVHLSAATLLSVYGTNGALNATGLQQAFAAIIACQLQGPTCKLGGHGETHAPTRLVAITTEAQAAPAAGDASAPREDVNWLKAVAAIVLFFEAMLGVTLPLLRRVSAVESAFQRGLMSVFNCFAGGVFITFAIMHLLLHVIGAQADSSYTAYFPIGVFFIVLGFMLFFFIQRVLGPLLTPAGAALGGSCCAAAVPSQGVSAKEGMEVGRADGAGCPCDQQAACRAPPAQRIWVSFISPSLLLFAMCIHGIFEGLTLGIQDTRVGAVTVLVALVCHKWVESLALSARCLKIGANWWQTGAFLLPFALTAPLGVGIGVALSDVNPWAQMVLYALATGFFIYVGACEVIGEEFAYGNTHSRGFRTILFLATMAGFTLVALLQLIHDGD